MPCDEIVQDSVAEELQSLVAVSQSVGVEGGVTKGLEQVSLVPPHVADHVLELAEAVQEVAEVPLRGGDGGGHDQGRGRGLEAERPALVILGQHLDPEPGHEEQRPLGPHEMRYAPIRALTQSAIDLSGMECWVSRL